MENLLQKIETYSFFDYDKAMYKIQNLSQEEVSDITIQKQIEYVAPVQKIDERNFINKEEKGDPVSIWIVSITKNYI